VGHVGELDPPAAGGGMSMSRRSFVRAMAAVSGAALIPFSRAESARGLSVSEAIRYLCNDVFALPAERSLRVAMPDWHRMEERHGR
jgi:hypothetical protein